MEDEEVAVVGGGACDGGGRFASHGSVDRADQHAERHGGTGTNTATVKGDDCIAVLQQNNIPTQANQQNESGFIEILNTDVENAIQNVPNTQTQEAIQKWRSQVSFR
jgi:hypothetical protein